MDSFNAEVNTPVSGGEIKGKKVLKEKTKKLIFYICMVAPFLLQVCIFYVYVNISNIALAFFEYEQVPGVGAVGTFVGFKNFKFILDTLFLPSNVDMFGISLIMYLIVSLVATPLSIIFSFYVYKKFPLSEFFRVILFFPQIISTVVMTMTYKYIVNNVYMQLFGAKFGLLDPLNGNTNTIFITVMFYNLWMAFGANILLASGAMGGINESVVESCHLDGCNTVQEFIYITLPSIFPTIITFIVIDLAAIFSNQMNLYTFYGKTAPENVWSIGYYLYVKTVTSPGLAYVGGSSNAILLYPQISAMGVMITLVILPITLTVRKLLEKFGPSTN